MHKQIIFFIFFFEKRGGGSEKNLRLSNVVQNVVSLNQVTGDVVDIDQKYCTSRVPIGWLAYVQT